MIRNLVACRLDKRSGEIDGFDKRVAGCAARPVRLGAGIIDDHRHLDGLLVKQILLTQPVIAQIVAVVRGQHDHRVTHPARRLKMIQQNSQLIVALLDQTHVGRDHLLAYVVALKRRRDAVGHIGAEDRVRHVTLNLVARWGRDVVGPVHIVIRRWHDIGPMRFDIADVSAPRRFGLVDKLDGSLRQPGGLAVFLADVGGLVGIVEHPARRLVTIRVNPRVGEVGPGVFRTDSPSA